MLKNIIQELDDKRWLDICNKCYHIKYKDYNVIELPNQEDSNINGFITSGILYQCHFPNRDYDDESLNENLQSILENGINELITKGQQLKNIGIEEIREWHLVVPEYRDRRILECCEKERKNIQERSLDYISSEFRVYIKTEEDFFEEIKKVIACSDEYKLKLSYTHSLDINLNDFPSEKVENIRRRLKAMLGNEIAIDAKNSRYDRLVKMYVSYYNQGIIILNRLREKCPNVYEKIKRTENTCKQEASSRCEMNFDSTINRNIFDSILEQFGNKLNENFKNILTTESISELKNDLVSGWLADCPMNFYM